MPRPASDYPAYLALLESGELWRRSEHAHEQIRDCVLCARRCRVDRLSGGRGPWCKTAALAAVHSYGPHHGEEDPLRGQRGSGAIFFSRCNMRCVFCQNWEISQRGDGREVEPEELARMMLELQSLGCHNINLVSPSHVVAPVLEALLIAAHRGLRLPLVYNTGGYDSLEALALLDGVVDIYMPDMKYGDAKTARWYSRARGYVETNQAAVLEMHRQVGDLVLDDGGTARRGLLVRHLVLPGGLASSGKVLKFIAERISTTTYVNLMSQYRPCYEASHFLPLDRQTTAAEFERAVELAHRHGLYRLDGQVAMR